MYAPTILCLARVASERAPGNKVVAFVDFWKDDEVKPPVPCVVSVGGKNSQNWFRALYYYVQPVRTVKFFDSASPLSPSFSSPDCRNNCGVCFFGLLTRDSFGLFDRFASRGQATETRIRSSFVCFCNLRVQGRKEKANYYETSPFLGFECIPLSSSDSISGINPSLFDNQYDDVDIQTIGCRSVLLSSI